MNNINLNSLKIFLEVANSKSFLDASNKLYISQPAISKSISKLEDDLGVSLFYRANKGISLTEAGEVLLKHIKESKSILESCERTLFSLNNTDDGMIIIGVRSHLVRNYLMDKITIFNKNHPKIKFKFVDNSTIELIEKLEDRKLDFIIDSSPIDTIYNNIIIKRIDLIDTCFIKSSRNESNIVKLKDLLNEKIILPSQWGSLRKNLDSSLNKKEIILNPIMEFETEELIIDAVRKNLGVGYVLKPAVSYLVNANILETIELKEKLPSIELNIVYIEKYLNKLSKVFIEEVIMNEK